MRSVENAECRKSGCGKRGVWKTRSVKEKYIKRLNEKIPHITPLPPCADPGLTTVKKMKNHKIHLLLIFKLAKLSTRKTHLSNSREINTRGNS